MCDLFKRYGNSPKSNHVKLHLPGFVSEFSSLCGSVSTGRVCVGVI